VREVKEQDPPRSEFLEEKSLHRVLVRRLVNFFLFDLRGPKIGTTG
jgi:hypothetical protein